jgi:hypothetical protein
MRNKAPKPISASTVRTGQSPSMKMISFMPLLLADSLRDTNE